MSQPALMNDPHQIGHYTSTPVQPGRVTFVVEQPRGIITALRVLFGRYSPRVSYTFEPDTSSSLCTPCSAGGGCQNHGRTGSLAGATHAILGTELDHAGNEVGGGVIVWCYSAEDAEQKLASMQDCRYYRDLAIEPHGRS